MREAIIFDTEFTTWEGAMQRRWSGPGEYRELVQIGAVRINATTFDVLETMELLTRPVRNPVLSDYFIKLTGITQEQLECEGVSFAAGLQRFMEFTKGLVPWSYGGDVDILAENMRLNSMPVPKGWWTCEQSNIATWFHQHAPETHKINSGRLALVVGAGQVHAEHTGLADSLSILAAAKLMVQQRGAPNPFLP